MKLYKVISRHANAKDGGHFDYTPYLPKGGRKGKWTPKISNVQECVSGYHVTPYWNMFIDFTDNRIFEVEVRGLIDKKDKAGVVDKYVASSIRLVKEIYPTYVFKGNTGNNNTGDLNSGYKNTGDKNTGDWNSGHKNTGYCNTGNENAGNYNTGDYNSGHRNTGDLNIGDYNTGLNNHGEENCGSNNTGDYNTGDYNSGHRNTGDWNSGKGHTGFFNTRPADQIFVFNKLCHRDEWDRAVKPNFIYFCLRPSQSYKDAFIAAFKKAPKSDIELLVQLPNFDYKVFEEISGISEKMIKKVLKQNG